MSVVGKTVLITGASRGFGRAAAIAFLKAGAHVVVTGRDRVAMAETETTLSAIGGTFQMVILEITDECAVTTLIESLSSLHVVINNAGISQFKPFLETTTDDHRRMMEVNVVAPFVIMRESARRMIIDGGGDIINIASTGAMQGISGMVSYATSKHALLGLGRSVRLELRTQGVRIVTVCPGPIRTEMLGPQWVNERAIEPEDLADLLTHIACVGSTLAVQEILAVPTRFEMPL